MENGPPRKELSRQERVAGHAPVRDDSTPGFANRPALQCLKLARIEIMSVYDICGFAALAVWLVITLGLPAAFFFDSSLNDHQQ